MLLSIFIGGLYTAGHIRGFGVLYFRTSPKSKTWNFVEVVIDIAGFAMIRTMKDEYEAQRLSKSDHQKTKLTKTELLKMRLGKLSGSLVESLLSFALVSYYLIIGTASFHQDVSEPSMLVFAAWFASIIGIMYKGYCAATSEVFYNAQDLTEVLSVGFAVTMLFILFALFPAFLLAQNRNAVHVLLCPEAIFSSIPLSYLLFWGVPIGLTTILVVILEKMPEGWPGSVDDTFIFV